MAGKAPAARNVPMPRFKKQRQGGKAKKAVRVVRSRIVRARNPNIRGLGAHHFNAFGKQYPQALAFSVGPCTQINGAARRSLTLDTDKWHTLLSFQPGSGLSMCMKISMEKSTGQWGSPEAWEITSNGIQITPSSSSPDTIMCSRGSLRLRNVGPAGSVAGVVHVMRVSTGLPNFHGDPTRGSGLLNLINENARTVSYSGSELTRTHQWDCVPVSQDKYHAFRAPAYASTSVLGDPGISTIMILFDHPIDFPQTYELSIAATHYARYQLSGPLANCASTPPTLGLSIINKMRDAAEAMGSIGKPVVEAVGQTLLHEAPGFLGNLMRQQGVRSLASTLARVPLPVD